MSRLPPVMCPANETYRVDGYTGIADNSMIIEGDSGTWQCGPT
jgi:hypothetical protein